MLALAAGMDVNMDELRKLVNNKNDLFQALTGSELRNPSFAAEISRTVCSTAGRIGFWMICIS